MRTPIGPAAMPQLCLKLFSGSAAKRRARRSRTIVPGSTFTCFRRREKETISTENERASRNRAKTHSDIRAELNFSEKEMSRDGNVRGLARKNPTQHLKWSAAVST